MRITVKHNITDREGDFQHIDCDWILAYAVAPNDGFPNLVRSMLLSLESNDLSFPVMIVILERTANIPSCRLATLEAACAIHP